MSKNQNQKASKKVTVTRKQMEVLRLMARGYGRTQIATILLKDQLTIYNRMVTLRRRGIISEGSIRGNLADRRCKILVKLEDLTVDKKSKGSMDHSGSPIVVNQRAIRERLRERREYMARVRESYRAYQAAQKAAAKAQKAASGIVQPV